jgi:hypothetical protein
MKNLNKDGDGTMQKTIAKEFGFADLVTSYIDEAVLQIYAQWRKTPAHSVDFNYPEQSLFWHVTDAAMQVFNLLDYCQMQTGVQPADPQELALCATFHDVDRTLGKQEYRVTLEECEENLPIWKGLL